MKNKSKVLSIFLDRDGVINEDYGYISKWKNFDFRPGVIEALQILTKYKFQIFIISNQSGIARGYFEEDDLFALHDKMIQSLKENNIEITSSIYCLHHPEANIKKYRRVCDCRKPNPGMINSLARNYEVNLANAILVGDKLSDVEAGKAAGIKKNFLIQSRYHSIDAPNVFSGLLGVVQKII